MAMVDCRGGWEPFKQVAEGSHGILGTAQVRFESGQVGGNDLVAGLKVRGVEHRADVLEGHLEVAEPPYHLGSADLVGGVAPVARGRVDVDRLEQADLVVMAQRLDTQVRRTGKVDRQGRGHHNKCAVSLDGRVKARETLTLPQGEARRSETEPAHREGSETSQPSPSKVITELPPIVAEHIAGVNAFDTDRIVNTFAADAFVNDNRREIWGVDAIRKFMDKEFVGDQVTMEVREIIDNYGDIVVRAKYDGTYDKSNLPDELIMSSYFSLRDGKIVSLAVIRNQPSAY